MNTNEFIKKVNDSVDIVTVIKKVVQLKRRGTTYTGICPFHNSNSDGKFIVFPDTQSYHCFACGATGDAVGFIKEFYGFQYQSDAAIRLAEDFGLITIEEAQNLRNGKDPDFDPSRMKKKQIKRPKSKLAKRKSLPELSLIYEYFSLGGQLYGKKRLSDQHRKYLNARGISDLEIQKYGYFTMPDNRIIDPLKKIASGYHMDLLGVPGFYLEGKHLAMSRQEGVGIPIRTSSGRIQGIQIRKDKPGKSKKYIWFSSGFANGLTNGKWTYGCSPGSPFDVTIPDRYKKGFLNESDCPITKGIVITEGHFKATSVTDECFCPSISVQGVGNWKGIEQTIREIDERYHNKIKLILIAYDADMESNDFVLQHAVKMSGSIKSTFGKKYKIRFLCWDKQCGKGIDDVLNCGHKGSVHMLSSRQFKHRFGIK